MIKSISLLHRITKNSSNLIEELRNNGFKETFNRNDIYFEKGDKTPGRLMVSIGAVKIWFFMQTGPQPWDLIQTAEFLAKRESLKAINYFLDEFILLTVEQIELNQS